MTNLEGKQIYKDNWKEVTQTDIKGVTLCDCLILNGFKTIVFGNFDPN